MASIPLNGTSSDTDIVRAIMLFPNDQALRDHYISVLRLQDMIAEAEDSKPMTVSAKDIKSLLAGPSWNEIKSLATEAVKGGTVAGDMLATMYVMNAFKGKHPVFADPSLNKAIHVMKTFGIGQTFGDGSPVPYSKGTALKHWKEFESVAHLWAAARLNQDYPYCDEGAWQHSVEACHTMLAVAAGIHKFGASYIPKRSKPAGAVFDADNAWTVPEFIGLRGLESNRLPDQLIKYLKSYSA